MLTTAVKFDKSELPSPSVIF